MTGEPLRVGFRRQVRERVLDTAAALTALHGWGRVRIGEVAVVSGVVPPDAVSRVRQQRRRRSGPDRREAQRFFTAIAAELEGHDDPVEGVRAAVELTIEQAGTNPVLRTVVTGTRGGDTALLPLLTTRGQLLITGGNAVVESWIRSRLPVVDPVAVADAVDAVERLTISHIISPGPARPTEIAERLGGLLACLTRRLSMDSGPRGGDRRTRRLRPRPDALPRLSSAIAFTDCSGPVRDLVSPPNPMSTPSGWQGER